MPSTSSPTSRYTATARWLHWLLALMILTALAAGCYMSGLPFSPARLKLVNWHKWLGISILGLSLLRLLWRLRHAPPPLSAACQAAMPAWQHRWHRLTHALMYLLFLAVPLLGWAYSSAAGFSIVYLGLLPLPDWVSPDKALADFLHSLHAGAAWTLAALIALHVAAVLWHQCVARDGLLWRMLPTRREIL